MTAPLLFALDASRDFGAAVAARLGLTLAAHEERTFEDGEHKLRPLVCVRGRHVFVIAILRPDATLSVNDKLLRLAMLTGALRDASAREITLVAPYLPYARKDRRTKPRDPLSLRYLAAMLEAVGADRIVTLEAHNPAAYENAFRCRTEHLPAAALFVPHLLPDLRRRPRIVVVSPDTGGYKRAQDFRQRLEGALRREIGTAFVEKLRSGGTLHHGRLVGDVDAATVLIVDDLIVTGRTLIHAARSCRAQGAAEVIAVAAHGLFDATAADVLDDPALDRIVVSDSAPCRLPAPGLRNRIETVTCAPFLADAIDRIHHHRSLSAWLGD